MGFEGVSDGFGRVEAAELQCTVDAHENGLTGRAAVATIRLTVLPQDDGGPDLPFPEVVVRGHVWVVQGCEDVLPKATQALRQSPGVSFVCRWYERISMIWLMVTPSP